MAFTGGVFQRSVPASASSSVSATGGGGGAAGAIGSALLNYHYDDDGIFDYSDDASYITEKMGFGQRSKPETNASKSRLQGGLREEPRYSAVSNAISDNYDPWRDIFQQGEFQNHRHHQTSIPEGAAAAKGRQPVAAVYQKRPTRKRRRRPPPTIDDQRRRSSQPSALEAENRRLWYDSDYEDGGGQTPTSDKKDFISGIYDESDDYFYVDGDLGGAEDKISYGSGYPEEFGLPPFGLPRPQQPPSLTERISEAVFSPLGVTITAVLILPFVLFGLYWLFVVNGPTPVVKARIDTVTQSTDIVSQNNVVLDHSAGVTYSEAPSPIYAMAEPYIEKAVEALKSVFLTAVLNAGEAGLVN